MERSKRILIILMITIIIFSILFKTTTSIAVESTAELHLEYFRHVNRKIYIWICTKYNWTVYTSSNISNNVKRQ